MNVGGRDIGSLETLKWSIAREGCVFIPVPKNKRCESN